MRKKEEIKIRTKAGFKHVGYVDDETFQKLKSGQCIGIIKLYSLNQTITLFASQIESVSCISTITEEQLNTLLQQNKKKWCLRQAQSIHII